jgi:hypothetical protein
VGIARKPVKNHFAVRGARRRDERSYCVFVRPYDEPQMSSEKLIAAIDR